MSQLALCRLCVNACGDYKSLYYANDEGNELYKTTLKYFHPKIVDMEKAKHLTVICLECYGHICDFHSFQTSVRVAQLKLINLVSVKTEQDDISDVIQHPQNLHHILDRHEESEEETDEKNQLVLEPEVEMSNCPGNGVSNLMLAEQSKHFSNAPICTIVHVPTMAWDKTESTAQSELNCINVSEESGGGSDDKDATATLYAADPCSKYTNEATAPTAIVAEKNDDENMDVSQPQLELNNAELTTATVGSAPKDGTKANEDIFPEVASNEASILQDDAWGRFESNVCGNRHKNIKTNKQHNETGKMPSRNAKRESVAKSAKNVIESGSKHRKTRRTQGNREAKRETLTRVSSLDAVSDGANSEANVQQGDTGERFESQENRKAKRDTFTGESSLDAVSYVAYSQGDGKDDDIANDWKCHVCGKTFACEKYVRRHLFTQHPETQAGYKYVYDEASKTFKCKLCGNGFLYKRNLSRHMSRQHGKLGNRNALAFKCSLCGNSYLRKGGLTRHVKRHHPEIAPDYDYDATTKRYKCKLCDNTFSQKNHLSRHVKRVHDGICKNGAGNIGTTEHITCNLCDCYYTQINALTSHMKKKHPEEPSTLRLLRRHKCTSCSKIFKTARALRRHLCVDMRRGNKRRGNSAGAKMNRSTGRDLKTIKRI